MEKQHILLCGPRGAGKSTLIEKLLSACPMPVNGYITRSTPRREDGYHSIYIYPAGSTERPREERNHIGECNSRERTVNPAVFETLGVTYLQPKAGALTVMDEMGFMELDSPNFLRCVQTALDGDGHVLAAVKARYDVPYLDAVRAHPKAQLYDITKENRDELFAELLPVLQRWAREE